MDGGKLEDIGTSFFGRSCGWKRLEVLNFSDFKLCDSSKSCACLSFLRVVTGMIDSSSLQPLYPFQWTLLTLIAKASSASASALPVLLLDLALQAQFFV